jgi:hypothetical protein
MKNLFIIILVFFVEAISAQKQNNNWVNGNRLWNFNNSTNGNFTDSSISTDNTFRQSVSDVSDRNTGNLLFYTNGITIYNKNSLLMEGGNDLLGPNTTVSMTEGNNAAQGSLIIPYPGDVNKYYVFSINTGYGLRYAIVDMSFNSGLGKVISKNTILINNTNLNSMTSSISNDGGHWLVTQNNAGNFLSYKITSSGISSPVVSAQTYAMATEGLKISPNKQYLFDIGKRNLFLFNNSNGSITFSKSFSNYSSYNELYNPCSAEFSEDSNVIYTLTVKPLFSGNVMRYRTDISKYIISSGMFYQSENLSKSIPGSLQRHTNGNIYMKFYDRNFGQTDNGWYKITNANSTVLNFNNIQYTSENNFYKGYTFPQLVEYTPECINTLTISQNITSNGNYKASNQITASSTINPNLVVDYAADNQILLTPGFQVSGNSTGIFRAHIQPCIESIIAANDPTGKISSKLAGENIEINNLKIYPNPVSNILNIDSGNEKLVSWQLYDVSGKLIKSGVTYTINVQSIPNANYILKINLEKTQISKKIIVKY